LTVPCPAPDGCRWVALPLEGVCPEGHALVNAAGLCLALVRDGDGWTIHGSDGRILRDGVTDARLADAIATPQPFPNPNRQE